MAAHPLDGGRGISVSFTNFGTIFSAFSFSDDFPENFPNEDIRGASDEKSTDNEIPMEACASKLIPARSKPSTNTGLIITIGGPNRNYEKDINTIKEDNDSYDSNACCICLEEFDHSIRQPLMLPCSHFFCRVCLSRLYENSNKLCPQCRTSWLTYTLDDLIFCPLLVQQTSSSMKININEEGPGDTTENSESSKNKFYRKLNRLVILNTKKVGKRFRRPKTLVSLSTSAACLPITTGEFVRLSNELSCSMFITDYNLKLCQPSIISVQDEQILHDQLLCEILKKASCELRLEFIEQFRSPKTWYADSKNHSSLTINKFLVDLQKDRRRCLTTSVLLELCCHLIPDSVALLPNTLRILGIPVANTSDLIVLTKLSFAMFGSNYCENTCNWMQFKELHLSLLAPFTIWEWSQWGEGASILLNKLHKSGIAICLHFPALREKHIRWMVRSLRKVAEFDGAQCYARELYFPQLSFPPQQLVSALALCNLQCTTVHLPCATVSHSPEGILEKLRNISWGVVWDLF